jgi:hypothetical protein
MTSTSPGNGDINVPVDSSISVVLNEPMKGSSFTTDSFRLLQPSRVTAVAAGGYHTVALKEDGTVAAWGDNDVGQTSVPAGLSGVTAVAAAGNQTVVLKEDGTVTSFGWSSASACSPVGLYESLVPAIVAYDPSTLTVTLTPTAPLAPAQTYTAALWGRREDGTPMSAEVRWSFTTEGGIVARLDRTGDSH